MSEQFAFPTAKDFATPTPREIVAGSEDAQNFLRALHEKMLQARGDGQTCVAMRAASDLPNAWSIPLSKAEFKAIKFFLMELGYKVALRETDRETSSYDGPYDSITISWRA